jgi:HAE1 family hydrophobic/amphiphilic exporter-1
VQVKIAQGLDRKAATSAAMKEVTAPVIATTLVLVAVFIPVAAMGGITGLLYQQFAITIAVSVVFSSVNALTLSPALCSVLLRPAKPMKGPLGSFFKGFNKVFDKSAEAYTIRTSIFANKLKRGVVYILIFVVAIVFVSRGVPGGFIPEEDQGYLFVNIQLPDAASLQRSDAVAQQIENILADFEDIDMVTNITGYSLISGAFSTNAIFMFVSLKDWGDREFSALELARQINGRLQTEVSEAIAFAFGPPAIPGLGNGSGFTLMLQDKSGNTPEFLAAESNKFMQAALARKEIGNIFTTYSASVPQRYIDIDKDKVLKSGVSLDDLYSTIGAFLGGAYVNDFNRFGRLYKTYVQAEPEFRTKPSDIGLFFVKNNEGVSIPISSFVNVKNIAGPEFTYRYNLYRAAELSGTPAPGYSSAQALNALEEVAAESLPDGMGFEWSNMSYQEKKAAGSGNIVFLFALVFVFLILAAQYESWSLPLSILLGTPFAILGAMLFLYLARFISESYVNNVFAQISLVMLIAMAAKNAILIIEFANLRFNEGLSLYDAAVQAAKERFRPILMTAFSFILGVLPLLVASGAGAEARKVMGMALTGGMLLATILGIFFYPMLYVLIGKLAGYEKKRKLAEEKVVTE